MSCFIILGSFLAAILDFPLKNDLNELEIVDTPSEMMRYIIKSVCTKFGASIRRVTIRPFFVDNPPYYKGTESSKNQLTNHIAVGGLNVMTTILENKEDGCRCRKSFFRVGFESYSGRFEVELFFAKRTGNITQGLFRKEGCFWGVADRVRKKLNISTSSDFVTAFVALISAILLRGEGI